MFTIIAYEKENGEAPVEDFIILKGCKGYEDIRRYAFRTAEG